MSLLRKSGTAVADRADNTETAPAKAPASRPARAEPLDKQQKAALRQVRAAHNREMRQVIGVMKSPEPIRAVFAGAVVFAIGVFSYLSKDVVQVAKTVHHKTVYVPQVEGPHLAQSMLIAIVPLIAISTIYFRRRVVAFGAFLLTGMLGLSVPLPASAADLKWVAFLVPAGYALWVYMLRQRKDQTAWLAEHPLPGTSGARSSSGTGRGAKASAARRSRTASSSRSRRGRDEPVAVGPNGKPLPTNSGRYTQPRSKPKPKPAEGRPASQP